MYRGKIIDQLLSQFDRGCKHEVKQALSKEPDKRVIFTAGQVKSMQRLLNELRQQDFSAIRAAAQELHKKERLERATQWQGERAQ